jgi:plastocyanin
MRRKSTYLAVAAVAVAVPLALLAAPGMGARLGLGGTAGTNETRVKVRVMDNFFDQRSIGVDQGGKVTWVWKGDNRHNVRFTRVPKGGSRKGSRTRRQGRWSRRFAKPGTYHYVCTLFAGMRGSVTVKPPTSGEGP